LVSNEDQARNEVKRLVDENKWPCLFSASNTTGEKDFEEFFTDSETLDLEKHLNLGIVKNEPLYEEDKLAYFLNAIAQYRTSKQWTKEQIVNLFHEMIPNFGHIETHKYLDSKM